MTGLLIVGGTVLVGALVAAAGWLFAEAEIRGRDKPT